MSLKSELHQAGAKPAEAAQLAKLAGTVKQLRGREPARLRLRSGRPRWRWAMPSLGLGGGLLAGLLLVTLAQLSLPGNLLYPAKRMSENVAVAVDPSFRSAMMMRRAQEVEQLVASNSSPTQVNSTLADYRTAVAHYHTTNYAAVSYCRANLQQAETMATDPERRAIAQTLSQFPSDLN